MPAARIARFPGFGHCEKKHLMVSGHDTPDTESVRQEAISLVARQALLFGEFSAKAAGDETFDDPVMHTYFLHYIFGAIDALGSHGSLPLELEEGDRVNAMGQALMTFEGSTREDVMGTLKMLYRARDAAAVHIREEGRKAAEQWDWGQNRDAVYRFVELLKDESNFPREVDPSPPLPTPGDTH
jgi:hypothetical protein